MRTTLRWTAAAAAAMSLICLPAAAFAAQAGPPAAPAPPSPAANAYLDAVRKGDVAAVEKALDGGVDVDTPFRYGRTALSFAADRGSVEVVRLLLARGAKPDVADTFYNQTPLAWASSPAQTRTPGHAEVVKLLLEKGAKGSDRALGGAIGADDLAMVQVILDHGGLSPAFLSDSLAEAKKANKAPIVAALEKAGATMPVVVTLTPAQLTRLPATYTDGSQEVLVTVKDGVVQAALGRVFTLSPRSETTFAVEGIPGLTVTFTLEGDRAISLTLPNQGGTPTVYKRVTKP
jgi:ankyrin repeat protein